MEVVKVFLEDPAALGGSIPVPETARPDAGAPDSDEALAAFLDGLRVPSSPFARAYLAGTHLADGHPLRVGLTALDAAEAWTAPLMTWAADRTWTGLTRGGRATGILDREALGALRDPTGILALALGPGPIPADILATVVLGDAEYSADAVRTLLLADSSMALLRPEPAHDGHDWTILAPRPLREPLLAAFRAHPAPPGVERYVIPRVRGEARFYFEQSGAPPAGTEPI